MPPSSDALHQHFLREAYQCATNELGMAERYTTIPIISMNLPQLVMCHCKRDCEIPCKCYMHGQTSMVLCKCKGLCSQNGNRSGEHRDRLTKRKITMIFFSKTTKILPLCIIFIIKTHSKSIIDARNEFADLK